MALFHELRRRRVFQTFALYVVGSWVLIQVAQAAFEAWDVPMQVSRYLWIGLILASPLALVFAWRYDITSDGIVRTPPAMAGESADLSLKTSDYLLLGALTFVLGMVAWGVFRQAGSDEELWRSIADSERPAIAVLPFTDLSPEGELGYFGLGVVDALLNELGHITELDVIARTSSFQFTGTGTSLAEIANRLAAGYLIEGSIARESGTVFVMAKLVEAASGRQLWSGTFEGAGDRPFTAQQEIASAVAGLLELSVGDPGKHGRAASFEAYDLYLRAGQAYENGDPGMSLLLLDEALAQDPEFATAMANKALLLGSLALGGKVNIDDAWRQAAPLLERAAELAPEMSKVYAAKGTLLQLRRELEGAEQAFRRALALNPSDTWVLARLSATLANTGHAAEAVVMAERSARLNPLEWWAWGQLGNRRLHADGLDGFIEANERALALEPPATAWVWTNYAQVVSDQVGLLEAFKIEARRQQMHGPVFDHRITRWLGLWFGFMGDGERFRALLELSLSVQDSALARMDLAMFALAGGDLDTAWQQAWLTLKGDSGNGFANMVIGAVALERGAGYDEVMDFYRGRWPGIFASPPALTPGNVTAAYCAAAILSRSGAHDRAQTILDAVIAGYAERNLPPAPEALAWRGDLSAALDALERREEAGEEMLVLNSAIYAPLREEPRFQALVERVRAGKAAKNAPVRAAVEDMIARGELVLPTEELIATGLPGD